MIPDPPIVSRTMDTPACPDWFDADRAAFMQSGVSMSVGSRDRNLRSSVSRALGCRVLPDGEVRVYVDASLSCDLLRHVTDCGAVAVVFSNIVSHRTLQVKATDARVQGLDDDDQRAADAYMKRFAGTVTNLGYPETVPRALPEPAARMAIVFHPHEGFEQTPGPQAGQRLECAR